MLAQIFLPELIGKNHLVIKIMMMENSSPSFRYRKKMGCFLNYLIYPDPLNNMTRTLKLLYATDLDVNGSLDQGSMQKEKSKLIEFR